MGGPSAAQGLSHHGVEGLTHERIRHPGTNRRRRWRAKSPRPACAAWSSTWGRSTRPRTACCACKLELDGETIVKCQPDIGYLHTGIEKEFEVKNYQQAVTLTDRVRLPGAAFQQPRLLPGRGEAAGPGDSAAGAVDARDAHRTDAPQQPPGVAGNARHRYRRHVRVPLLLPRARRHPADFRDVLRPAHDDQLFPHRRAGARTAARLAAAGQAVHRRVPQPRGRIRRPAHQQPHLDRAHARRRLHSRSKTCWTWASPAPCCAPPA